MPPKVSLLSASARQTLGHPTLMRLALAVAASVGIASGAQAQAQGPTASQITPPTFQPPAQRLSGAVVFSGKPGLEAPPGAEKLSIRIVAVEVTGTLPGMQAATSRIESQLTAGRIPVSRIFTAAQELEKAYARAGYVLARVVLPQQRLRDGGTLKLTMVDGFVEKIDTSAVPASIRGRLDKLTEPLLGRTSLKLKEIERRLLLAGDTYGVALGSALSTGATPGGTVIVLQPKFRKVTGFVGIDNSYSDALGPGSLSAGLEFNGLLGLGEAFYLRGSGHPDFDSQGGSGSFLTDHPRLRTLAAGAVLPIGNDGLTFNLEATESRTAPRDQAAQTNSVFRRVSTRLFYPWLRSRNTNITTQLAFDINSDNQDLVTSAGRIPIYKDRTRVLRAAVDGTWIRDKGGVIEAGAILSFGLDAFGARSASDATPSLPLSRQGADDAFTKLQVTSRYRRRFDDGKLGFMISGRAQTSFGDPLVTSEQIDIASTQDLSAFDSGTLSGDSGWAVRSELSLPMDKPRAKWPFTASPYVFGAVGSVYRAQPVTGEAGSIRADAFGVGVDLTALRDSRFSSASLRLELSKGNRSDGGSDDYRVTAVGSYRF